MNPFAMLASLKAAAVLLLQLAVRSGEDAAATSVTGVSPAPASGGDYLMVHGLQVDPRSLAAHRTDLFRFDYPYLTSEEQLSNRACPGWLQLRRHCRRRNWPPTLSPRGVYRAQAPRGPDSPCAAVSHSTCPCRSTARWCVQP